MVSSGQAYATHHHRLEHGDRNTTYERAPVAVVVGGAAAGDEDAWRVLFERVTPMLRRVAGGFRLGPADVDDVVQATWSRALSHISALNDPAAVTGWLVVIARRESLRLLHGAVLEVVTDEPPELEHVQEGHPEMQVLEAERRDTLWAAVRRLPERQRALVEALITLPWRSYDDLSAALAMPVGSIGPTRIRSLERLRCDRELAQVMAS